MTAQQLRNDFALLRDYQARRLEVRTLSQFRESVINHASTWINVLDPMARVVVWNKAAKQISGYSRADVIGNAAIYELLYPDPDYRTSVTRTAAKILEQGAEVEEFETRIRAKNGEEIWV
jgi:PAS domain S-box-containing protein